jgi:hypothetical protein
VLLDASEQQDDLFKFERVSSLMLTEQQQLSGLTNKTVKKKLSRFLKRPSI